jgi:putative endonuclease
MRPFFVYILASHSRRLYIGVTNDLHRRMYEHLNGMCAFTRSNRITKLVHFETTANVVAAITREKRIKGWLRSKKIALIEQDNPFWIDLAAGWFDATSQ